MIVRGPRSADHFTIVRNEPLRDSRLSYRARGVLAFLLSQPSGYQCSAQELADHGKEGRGAMLTALTELQTAGYLVRRKYQDERGQWCNESTVYESPEYGNPTSDTSTSKTEGLEEEVLTPSSPNGDTLSLIQSEDLPPDDSFDRFWKAYPKRHGKRLGKALAQKRWDAMARGDRDGAMAAVVNYAKACEHELAKDAERWLKHRCWEEWLNGDEYQAPTDSRRETYDAANELAWLNQRSGL